MSENEKDEIVKSNENDSPENVEQSKIQADEKLNELENTNLENDSEETASGDLEELLTDSDDETGEIDESDPTNYESEKVTEAQQRQYEKLGNVKEKISKILKASNIEIIDENIGDEYESDGESDSKKQQQQDYDSLKALFGDADKNKKNELTLTIDDFDYTYVGQYVDELDLMHVKGIKHIKLQRKHSKHFKKFVIAAAVILVAGLGGLLGFLLLRQKPVTLQSVALNQTSNIYYVNQNFEYTGLYFVAKYSDGTTRRIPLSNEYLYDVVGSVDRSNNSIKFLGGAQADLTFTYNGFNVVYNVEIKHKTLEGIQAFYTDGLFNLKAGEYLTNDYLIVLCDYGEYGVEELALSSLVKITVDGHELVYSSNNNGYIIENELSSLTSVIKIEYNGFPLEFDFEQGAGIIKGQ